MGTIPYVPTYLRATPPTIWPVTSPLDFGAIGNGSADDYPAITAALQALAAKGGGTLVFPNDRDFRIATPGVHGIHLSQQSNITIMMGERSRLIMDNMVDGLAVSHGIFVEGPCENISLIGVHVTFAALSVSRQVWAPIYFLGANVGAGDAGLAPALGWYRGNPDGTEAWEQIEAGAVRNVYLENVTCENSPSVGIGIVGVDGLRGYNITLRHTWADGLYHLYFRNARIDGYYGYRVGDDALSLASYESDIEACDIELPFHGEGSVFSNIVLEGRTGDAPSGSIVPLGVRDVVFQGVVIRDRFRGVKLEAGTHLHQDYPTLSLNFLANRRVIIDDVTCYGLEQDISMFCQETNAGTPEKWWRHNMTISNFSGENGTGCFDFFPYGIPLNGGPPQVLVAGITFRNLKFIKYSNPAATLAGLVDCTFDGLEMDSFLSIQGFVPLGSDPDLLDGEGHPMWMENRCIFRNIRCQTLVFQGVKRSWIDGFESNDAPNRGIVLSGCADVRLTDVRVVNPNRVNDPLDNTAIYVDEFCKRISGSGLQVQTDGNAVHSLGIRSVAGHWFDDVTLSTTQGTNDPNLALVSDSLWNDEKRSQVGRATWHHSGNDLGWGVREWPKPLQPELNGDSDVDAFVGNQGAHHRLIHPLSGDRNWILHEDRAAVGDRITVAREATSTGDHAVTFQGQSAATSAFPVSDASTVATVDGGPGGTLSSLLVTPVTGTSVELLGAGVVWTTSNESTASLICDAINARTGTSGFTATVYAERVAISAPAGSEETYNNARVLQTHTGDMLLSIGFIPVMIGGANAASAGETPASTNFLIVGDFVGMTGTIASITVNGTELLAAPVAWGTNSNYAANAVARAIQDNIAAHGFSANSGRNSVIIKAPPGHGSSANGWPVVVTPTGDVTTYDVHPMGGGTDAPTASASGTPYDIVSTIRGAPFSAAFEFAADGWKLVSLVYDQPRYPNGRPLLDSSNRLLSLNGDPIVDEFKNLKYANGSVLGWDSGRLGIASVPPAGSSADGVAGMVTWDSVYLYVCTAANTWKRIALSSF
ncbi:hypothetical protein [Reyranella sp.]|uniref:hypothetical protein n=1 Tax=Reyranella sp. TaxID=1929291 RepID=UPI003D105023